MPSLGTVPPREQRPAGIGIFEQHHERGHVEVAGTNLGAPMEFEAVGDAVLVGALAVDAALSSIPPPGVAQYAGELVVEIGGARGGGAIVDQLGVKHRGVGTLAVPNAVNDANIRFPVHAVQGGAGVVFAD